MYCPQVAKGPVVLSIMSNSIKIVEPKADNGAQPMAIDALLEADEDLARRMQAKMDAKEHADAGRCVFADRARLIGPCSPVE